MPQSKCMMRNSCCYTYSHVAGHSGPPQRHPSSGGPRPLRWRGRWIRDPPPTILPVRTKTANDAGAHTREAGRRSAQSRPRLRLEGSSKPRHQRRKARLSTVGLEAPTRCRSRLTTVPTMRRGSRLRPATQDPPSASSVSQRGTVSSISLSVATAPSDPCGSDPLAG